MIATKVNNMTNLRRLSYGIGATILAFGVFFLLKNATPIPRSLALLLAVYIAVLQLGILDAIDVKKYRLFARPKLFWSRYPLNAVFQITVAVIGLIGIYLAFGS